jgi:hypothetical protein
MTFRSGRLLEKSIPNESCVLALQTIDLCIEGLKHKHENQLLPVVHETWPSLIVRLKDTATSSAVRRMTFLVICHLARACGDFLRKRAVQDVVPHVLRFLEMELKTSSVVRRDELLNGTNSRFKFDLLPGLATLVEHLDLSETQVSGILKVATQHVKMSSSTAMQVS